MKAEVAAFNQEKALVGAFSVITNLRMQFGCNFLKHYLSHSAPIIDTAVSFSDVQANSFSLLWIDTAPLHFTLCVVSGGSGLGARGHVAGTWRSAQLLACPAPAPAPQGAGQRTGWWMVLHNFLAHGNRSLS